MESINIENREVYLRKVYIKYSIQRFYVYAYSHDTTNMEKEYAFLKTNNSIGLRIFLVRIRGKSKILDKIVRTIHR